jgi:hypothetical protein
MTRVVVISPGSKVAEVKTVGSGLADWQALVGGDIESLTLSAHVRAFINEEGKYAGLPRNEYGDLYAKAQLSLSGRSLMPGDYIAGPLVLMGPPVNDEPSDVPDTALDELRLIGMEVGDD